MRLKTSMREKVTYSLICVFVLFVWARKKQIENWKLKKREKSPRVNVLGSLSM